MATLVNGDNPSLAALAMEETMGNGEMDRTAVIAADKVDVYIRAG